MAKAYSYDFRQKVMQAIELDGLKKSEASELFNISRNTINLWCQRKAATTDVQVKPREKVSKGGKIPTGRSFAPLPKCTKIRLRWRWLSCGSGRLAVERFHGRWQS
jgi:hypothetical protein